MLGVIDIAQNISLLSNFTMHSAALPGRSPNFATGHQTACALRNELQLQVTKLRAGSAMSCSGKILHYCTISQPPGSLAR
jgi:D-Tyr-tRNAtyr deacylase